MRVIAVNHVSQPERRAALPPNWDVHVTDEPIGDTYWGLTQKALNEGWGLDTIVIQDDMRFTRPPYAVDAELVVYGQTRADGRHVCPKGFAATEKLWRILSISWSSRPKTLCAFWMPPVLAFGQVLDVMEPAHG